MGPTPPAQTVNEKLAHRLLDQLRGYTRRQELAREDHAMLVAMLDEWSRQVAYLDAQIQSRQEQLDNALRQIRHLEWRLATQPARRVWHYLKFITGATEWPLSQ